MAGVPRAGAITGMMNQPSGQVFEGSLKFDRTESHYLSRTFSAGNRKTFTFSFWVKAFDYSEGASVGTGGGRIFGAGTTGSGARSQLGFEGASNPSADRDKFSFGMNPTSGWKTVKTEAFFRDFSSWQNFIVAVDCTQSTSSDRVKIYHNGVEQALSGTYPDNEDQPINSAVGHAIGRYNAESADYFNGLLSNFYFIDGQQLSPSDFGFTDLQTNTWKPKKYEGTFGTNGFWLPLDSEDDFEKDKSGNGNDWTKNNFSGTHDDPDVLKDSPSGALFGGREFTGISTVSSAPSNYCVLNPLDSDTTLSNGNLTITGSGTAFKGVRGTISMTEGKHYFESTLTDYSSPTSCAPGIWNDTSSNLNTGAGSYGNAYLFVTDYGGNFKVYVDAGSTTAFESTGSLSDGDIIGIALDLDNAKCYAHINGTYLNSGNSVYDTWPRDTYFFGGYEYTTGNILDLNFGQKPFKYAPPRGFLPLNTASNTPEKVITRPDQYVGITTWSGNSGDGLSTTQDIDVGLNPDLIWIKDRTGTNSNLLTDTVRGLSNQLISNSTAGHNTNASRIPTLINNGFRVGDRNEVNDVGSNYVAWCWKAGGNKNTFNIDDIGYSSASDAGVNIGGQNSNYYDSSDTWSDDCSSPQGVYAGSSISNAFDGDLSTKFEAGSPSGSHSTIRFEPATVIKVKNQIRIYAFDYSDGNVTYQYRVNDGTFVDISYDSGSSPYFRWIDLNFRGDLVSFEYRSNTSSTYKPSLSAIEIDGRQLLDSGVTPTDNYPTIAATGCSVGTKQGFSIIKYTGNSTANATLPHGLSEAPKFVIIKNLSNTYGWAILHTDVGTTGTTVDGSSEYYMMDFSSSERQNWSADTIWNPTSTTVKIDQSGGANWVNNSNSEYIMYAWHDVPGLQKFGGYQGRSGANYINLGFRPALVVIKFYDGTDVGSHAGWKVIDNERNKFNVGGIAQKLAWDVNEAENGGTTISTSEGDVDFLSHGFRIRDNHSPFNTSGRNYIYMAWAESPASNLFGAASNAR